MEGRIEVDQKTYSYIQGLKQELGICYETKQRISIQIAQYKLIINDIRAMQGAKDTNLLKMEGRLLVEVSKEEGLLRSKNMIEKLEKETAKVDERIKEYEGKMEEEKNRILGEHKSKGEAQ